jgi:hypothetical protein
MADIKSILSAANKNLFIDQHRELIKNSIPKGLVLIACGGSIKLYDNGELISENTDFRSELFHRLKEISHLYMAVYFMVKTNNMSKKKELETAVTYVMSKVDELETDLHHEILTERDVYRLMLDIDLFLIHINDFLKVSNGDFEQLNKTVHIYLEKFITISAQAAEVDLHNYIQKIKQDKLDKWDNISVIVLGRSVHRIGDVCMQYFGRMTGKEHEELSGYFKTGWNPGTEEAQRKCNRKLLYGENIINELDAQLLLAEHNIAQSMGKDIFGKNTRMFYDLLAEKAAEWLSKKCDKH